MNHDASTTTAGRALCLLAILLGGCDFATTDPDANGVLGSLHFLPGVWNPSSPPCRHETGLPLGSNLYRPETIQIAEGALFTIHVRGPRQQQWFGEEGEEPPPPAVDVIHELDASDLPPEVVEIVDADARCGIVARAGAPGGGRIAVEVEMDDHRLRDAIGIEVLPVERVELMHPGRLPGGRALLPGAVAPFNFGFGFELRADDDSPLVGDTLLPLSVAPQGIVSPVFLERAGELEEAIESLGPTGDFTVTGPDDEVLEEGRVITPAEIDGLTVDTPTPQTVELGSEGATVTLRLIRTAAGRVVYGPEAPLQVEAIASAGLVTLGYQFLGETPRVVRDLPVRVDTPWLLRTDDGYSPWVGLVQIGAYEVGTYAIRLTYDAPDAAPAIMELRFEVVDEVAERR